jgi:hypothetical protein
MTPADHLYLGLVHHPVYDKRGDVVATAVNTFDIHDIARCCRTFGAGGYYIITPLKSQAALTEKLVGHWVDGAGAEYNPNRAESLSLVRVVETIGAAAGEISARHGRPVRTVTTGAARLPGSIGFGEFRAMLETGDPFLMLFGTGWGLTREVKAEADFRLAPIEGKGYNHLSVRSAVAIILDRLLGEGTE